MATSSPAGAQLPSVDAALTVLDSDADVYDQAMACRALAFSGDERAAPALAKLLADPQLATYARSALETLPGEAANEALRGALDALNGELLVGAIDSLGKRRDGASVERLAKLRDDGVLGEAEFRRAKARLLG